MQSSCESAVHVEDYGSNAESSFLYMPPSNRNEVDRSFAVWSVTSRNANLRFVANNATHSKPSLARLHCDTATRLRIDARPLSCRQICVTSIVPTHPVAFVLPTGLTLRHFVDIGIRQTESKTRLQQLRSSDYSELCEKNIFSLSTFRKGQLTSMRCMSNFFDDSEYMQ